MPRRRGWRDVITAVLGAFGSREAAAGSDAMRQGMDDFERAAEHLQDVGVGQRQGNLFEYIETAKFNAEASGHGSNLHAVVTAIEGHPHDPADIRILDGDRVVRLVQAKSYSDVGTAAEVLGDEKYHGMERLVPDGQGDAVAAAASAHGDIDVSRNVTDQLTHGGVGSGGTTHNESVHAALDPHAYAASHVAAEAGHELLHGSLCALLAGAIVQGTLSILEERRVSSIVVKGAANGAARGAVLGGANVLARNLVAEIGPGLTPVVTAPLASGIVRIGRDVRRFARGEITKAELASSSGHTGARTFGGMYLGAAAGGVIGVGGALVGTLAGYWAAGAIYQATAKYMLELERDTAEYRRLAALYGEVADAVARQRDELERIVATTLDTRRVSADALLSALDKVMESGDANAHRRALSDFADVVGVRLELLSPEEFRSRMMRRDGAFSV